MKYGVLFLVIAVAFGVQAAIWGNFGWLLMWPALSFFLVASAYFGARTDLFGKKRNGTMKWGCVVLLLPYLLLTWVLWHVVRLMAREKCWNEVVPGVYVGRRPLPYELPEDVSLVVDLTAEFIEPRRIRKIGRYLCFPMLDTGIADTAEFRELVRDVSSWPEPVYIHCAQGHGRTGTVAAAVLVAKGAAATAGEAVQMLRSVRPALDLDKRQRKFVEAICEAGLGKGNSPDSV